MIGLAGQDGVVAGRMEAEDDFGAGRYFEAHALCADRHAAIGAGLDEGAEAPNKRPPRAAGGWAQDGALGPPGRSQACCGVMRASVSPEWPLDKA